MYLYSLTLSRATAITAAVSGSFTAPRLQEIAVSRGKVLDLLRPDETGRLHVVHSWEAFGLVRSLAPFRFPGGQRDYLIVSSDSGRLVILEWSTARGRWAKVHQETFGKSGVRRSIAGQYLATDPKGRACMVASLERQKFVYVLNRDSEANLTISSPLEAHRSSTLTIDVVGLDQGFDNPRFAAIELSTRDVDEDSSGTAAAEAHKVLTFYELDLGLNHVVRLADEGGAGPLDAGASRLVPVPGAGDGPGGVLVVAEDFVLWRNVGVPELRAVLPRRRGEPGGVLVVAVASHRQKGMFFVLLQSERGDICKATLAWEGDVARSLTLTYFDTIAPASALCVLRKGFLFAASEAGDHALYQFASLGEDDTQGISSSDRGGGDADRGAQGEGYAAATFEPRALTNLELVDAPASLAPLLALQLIPPAAPGGGSAAAAAGHASLVAACGRGARSSLRALSPGASVSEAARSALPGHATGVWTLKKHPRDAHDSMIVVSFSSSTLVLGVSEAGVQEVSGSGLLSTAGTLRAGTLADGSLLQAHAGGLRHVRPDRRANEWRAPGRRAVARAAFNARQAVLALAGGELVALEMAENGMLAEVGRRELGCDVAALDIPPPPPGMIRAPFLALGAYDGTVRLLSLDPERMLAPLATLAAGAVPESVLLLDDQGVDAGAEGGAPSAARAPLSLQAGLSSGVLLRAEVDRVTGSLSDTRSRFLGARPPKLAGVALAGRRAALALSTQPWLAWHEAGRFSLAPLATESAEAAAAFSSEACPDALVLVGRSGLRVVAVDAPEQAFAARVARLRYTPRALALHPNLPALAVAEADHACRSVMEGNGVAEKGSSGDSDQQSFADALLGPAAASAPSSAPARRAPQGPEASEEAALARAARGDSPAEEGRWASCVRLVDPNSLLTLDCWELSGELGALCACFASFEAAPELGQVLVVGAARGLSFYPRRDEGGALLVFRLARDGRGMELLHATPLDGAPRALAAFRGRLLVGVGASLRLYEFGKKKLLRKCEHRRLPHAVSRICAQGSRAYVADAHDSFTFLKYKRADNAFYAFADDAVPRHLVAALALDYDTVAGADRFGSLSVLRLPKELSAAVEEDPTAGKFADQAGLLGGAPNKLETLASFHVGEMVTALAKGALQAGGRELLLYATLLGGLGALLPFLSREDADFFQLLEMHMRQHAPSLVGRDHLAFRSAFYPVRCVVDGDLCEQFAALPDDTQRQIAQELDRSPGEILKKLEDLRNKIV